MDSIWDFAKYILLNRNENTKYNANKNRGLSCTELTTNRNTCGIVLVHLLPAKNTLEAHRCYSREVTQFVLVIKTNLVKAWHQVVDDFGGRPE